ncbi:hypothetical protein [Lentzea sp. NEAU-D7]|uniref:hypothetical protein n=1 Tax=Lentzea sp. NEAU-D7 TaxID=2994667 RepID=UPI00224B38C5|nr:hypothetical protein [Lentzea sp. NEAU-D7]MCX2948288.1 hypothetical protein [Lentzea sp. NEAU-D7]
MTPRSGAFGALLNIAEDEHASWRAVQLAGRGIALYAFANQKMPAEKATLSAEELASRLIAEEEMLEDLETAWRSYEDGDLSPGDLVPRLEAFVNGFREHHPEEADS